MITQARHSGSKYIATDADDPTAYDENGFLRDGFKIRVPIEMMDSTLPLQRVATVPRNISTGLRGKDSLDNYFFPDGSPKPARTPRPERTQQVVDANQFNDHRPGFRDAASVRGVIAADGEALKNAAYNEMCHDLQDAWKPDYLRAADARLTADAGCPAGVDPRDFAYRQMCTDLQDAWKVPPVFDAAAVETPPVGAYCKAGVGAKEGDIVTWNGAPARLVKRGDRLFPEVHQQGPTRSGTSSGDAVPRTMDAATAQRIKDTAYEAMVTDISNAWRT
jgi:hypothetical protein